MKALVLHDSDHSMSLEDVPRPAAGAGEVLVRMQAAALNRRDYWISQGQYARIAYPAILGSDGCGVVEAAGDEAGRRWIGKRVIINPGFDWGEDEQVKSRGFHILGMPSDGTFAEYTVAPTDYLHEAPVHLDDAHAAALPLSGLTAYRALVSKGQAGPGKKVLISGVGGGTAQLAFQLALALDAETYVTTGSDEKLERALDAGARGGANYRKEDWARRFRQKHGAMDVIIDSAGGDQINDLLGLLSAGGKLVIYGSTLGTPGTLNTHRIFWNELQILGSTMGSPADFRAMLDLVNTSKLVPAVDSVRPFAHILEAFAMMKQGTQYGKLVVVF